MLVTKEDDRVPFPTSPQHVALFATRDEAINLPRLRKAVHEANAGSTPTDAHLFLRDARAALRRGGYRRAVIDAGSAVELTLAQFNAATTRVNTGGRATLGWYVNQPAIATEANLPSTLGHDLVDLRNNAIHQNRVASCQETVRALALAKQVVARLDPLPI
jgi:hypothetical protein